MPPALAVTGKVWDSGGLGGACDRNELERPELGGRAGFVDDSSSAETDPLDGMV